MLRLIDGKPLDPRQPFLVVEGVVLESVCKCSIRHGVCANHGGKNVQRV